jgi:hypothetical protein
MRASDSDRDRVLSQLREGYAQGRITFEELSERVTRTLSAQTHDELNAIVEDLEPRQLPAAPPPPPLYPYPYRYRGYRGHRAYPAHYRGRPGLVLPLVLILCFWWVPWIAGAHFLLVSVLFLGTFFLFRFWRRALRF